MTSRLMVAALLLIPTMAAAQGGQSAPEPIRRAVQLDRAGKTADARAVLKAYLDTATDAAARAQAHRTMAMSYAFDGDCANTIAHEQQVIDYWKTREADDPQNAFYQQGEMANEGARVCVDAGDLQRGEQWYRMGWALGMKEPEPRTHSAALWDFRLAHALARIAARRGDKAEAQKQVALARKALDSDSAMARSQERFFPYLTGYVALYTGDVPGALRDLEHTVSLRGNERDPFFNYLLGMAYEKAGRSADAQAAYQKAAQFATAHNPPSAYVTRMTNRN